MLQRLLERDLGADGASASSRSAHTPASSVDFALGRSPNQPGSGPANAAGTCDHVSIGILSILKLCPCRLSLSTTPSSSRPSYHSPSPYPSRPPSRSTVSLIPNDCCLFDCPRRVSILVSLTVPSFCCSYYLPFLLFLKKCSHLSTLPLFFILIDTVVP